MNSEARPITKQELMSILEDIQKEVLDDRVKGLQIIRQNMISTETPSPYIMTANLSGKQFIISLVYGEHNG